jgi:hypothetical protein
MAGAGGKRAAGDLVFVAVTVIAIILIGYIVFTLIGANAQNDIVRTDADWSSFFATWFKDLFTPKSPKLNVFLNYGLATLVYLAVGGILRRVLNDAFA